VTIRVGGMLSSSVESERSRRREHISVTIAQVFVQGMADQTTQATEDDRSEHTGVL